MKSGIRYQDTEVISKSWILLCGLISVVCFLSFILLPYNANAQDDAKSYQMIVANRLLGIGDIIEDMDVRIESRKRRNDRAAVVLENVIGKRVRRPIGKDNVVNRDYLRNSLSIRSGDRVSVLVKRDNLIISVSGIARSGGGLGDTIDIENASSGRVIRGRVLEPGMVEVGY